MQRKRTQRLALQPHTRQRQRAYAACLQCRRRKRKCDGHDPCSSCASYGYTCSYVQEAETTNDSQETGHETPPPAINGTLQQPIAAAPPQLPTALVPSRAIFHERDERSNPWSHTLIIDKQKGRFVESQSAIALPHVLSRSLQDTPPLRLHSFAWHLGIRPIITPSLPPPLSGYLTLEECCKLVSRYFSVVHPVFPFLPTEGHFCMRMRAVWGASSQQDSQADFLAVVAGVVALGSFFSELPHPRESDIKQYAITVLDLTFSAQIAPVTLDTIAGWILRTVYARLTCRPAVSSLATHTTMHLVDMLSLHKGISSDAIGVSGERVESTPEELDTRRRHYWVARMLNQLLCAEFGVSPVELFHPTCAPMIASVMSETGVDEFQHVVSLGEILGSMKREHSEDHMSGLFTRLGNITSSNLTGILFKADTCLCLLREMLSQQKRLSSAITSHAVPILLQSLQAIPSLIRDHQPWWNTIIVPFQTICIALSLDDRDFLTLLMPAMDALRLIVDTYNSCLAEEALKDAQKLIASSRGDTAAKMDLKDEAVRHVAPCTEALATELYHDAESGWPVDIDFDTFDLGDQLFSGL